MSDTLFFLGEAIKALRLRSLPNTISIACIGLAFLTLSFLMGAWWNLEHLLNTARSEAEIVLYLQEDADYQEAMTMLDLLSSHEGVKSIGIVTREEALERMEAFLGPGLDLWDILEGSNPLPLTLEIAVSPEQSQAVARFARNLRSVEYVRDNEEILAPLASITRTIRWVGLFSTASVIVATLALISHIVRLGILARTEEIETLRLLGASELFVSLPFILEGAMMGLLGGVFALLMILIISPYAYNLIQASLPFLPLLPWPGLLQGLAAMVLALGLLAGTLGGLISLGSN